jgi:alpha-glucosidase
VLPGVSAEDQMKWRAGLLLFTFALVSQISLAQIDKSRRLPLSSEFGIQGQDVAVYVSASSDAVIRVEVARNEKSRVRFGLLDSWAVPPEAHKRVRFIKGEQSASAIRYETKELRVEVRMNPMRIRFMDLQGNVISEDHLTRRPKFEGQAFEIWKSMPEDEHYFGLGEKAGPLDHRGRSFHMWNTDFYGWQESDDPLYKSVPFFLALRKGMAYGIFLDNTWRTFFDFGTRARDGYSFGADGGPAFYYFIYGPHPKQVLERYAELTGRVPLPPLYALGYQQCRYSYFPESRVREVAQTFRQKKIPADVIYLDIDYQDGNRPFTIDRQRFPTFEDMISDLHADNWRVVAITDLHLKKERGYKPYDEGTAGDHFVKNPDGSVYVGKVWPGESVFPEFTLERSRRWWGSLYRDFVEMGLDGFWNDMNEPAIFEVRSKTMPLDTVHRLDDGRRATHREIHNVFGMQNSRATYEGLLRLRPNQRPFVLTRATYAGGQRYAATWTGDNTSSWNHMRISIPGLLNLGLSGFSFVGADIGGFAGSPPPDLLTRWIQLGAFNPIFRNHTEKGSKDQEPWVHGPEHEGIRRRYIELRYRLMPYNYTIMEESSRTGVPLMRPLFLEYPDAPEQMTTNDRQFFWGRDLLIAPMVVEAKETYDVGLPPGEWFDYWTGERLTGARGIQVTPKLDQVPIYVRAGAIIPHQPVVQSTAERPNGPLELHVYPGPDCKGSLYWDDGATLDYQKGEFLRVTYTCEAAQNRVRVRISPEGTFAPWWERVDVRVHGAERAPRSASIGGQPTAEWKHDPASRTVSIAVPATAREIAVEF